MTTTTKFRSILAGAALLLLAGTASAQMTVPMLAQNNQRYVIVACNIEGVDHALRCMIDSGAAMSAVSNKVLQADGSGTSRMLTANGGSTPVFTRMVHYTIGGQKISGLCMLPLLDSQMEFDAVIGEDVLQLFGTVAFDFQNRTVIFTRKI